MTLLDYVKVLTIVLGSVAAMFIVATTIVAAALLLEGRL